MHIDRQIAVWAGWIAGPAFGVAMMAAPEYFRLGRAAAGLLFWGGIVVFLLTTIVVFALLLHEAEKRHVVLSPILMMFCGAVIFFVGAAWYFWPQQPQHLAKEKSTTEATASKPLSNRAEEFEPAIRTAPLPLVTLQIQQLHELDEFVGKKDEMELRTTFDFPSILNVNFAIYRKDRAPNLVKAEEQNAIDYTTRNGQARIDLRRVRANSEGGGVRIEFIDGEIPGVWITPKCLESQSMLRKFATSAELPAYVRDAVIEFTEIIDKNLDLLTESMNESSHDSPSNILFDNDGTSRYFGMASARYWRAFQSLRPYAEKISASIRKYFDVK